MAEASDYTSKITSEHANKPNFVAWVAALCQPFVDIQNVCATIPGLFDVDVAVGDQLDKTAQWIGITRQLQVPLSGVFFSWGIAGVGWGEGTWLGPYDSETGLTVLPDDAFRTLVLAKIAANQWNGTIVNAYAVWAQAFGPNQILIQDNLDMTITIIWLGATDAVTLALLASGFLDLRTAGVLVRGYFKPSVPSTPVFGWGVETALISGWGTGSWIEPIE